LCGQCGCAGTLNGNDERIFQHLLIYNSTRGLDSTGAGSVKRHNAHGKAPQMVVAKELGNPFELLSIERKGQHDIDDVLSGTQRALLGHCRAKTTGAIHRKNAHPFMFDNIIGTHNGTLSYMTHQKLTGAKKFETDSEALYYEIEQFGIAEAMKKIRASDRENVQHPDAYALVWYDAKNNSINFLRNKERPLWFCFSKDRQKLFWSSEKLHLAAATDNAIIHDEKYLHCLPTDQHYSWEIPEAGKQFGKPRVTARVGNIDPFGVQGSVLTDYRNKNGGNNDTAGNNSWKAPHQGGNAQATGEAWGPDDFHGFFEKFSPVHYAIHYGAYKHGTFYPSLQEAWDSLTIFEQQKRIEKGIWPTGIDINKKVGKPSLAPSCDIRQASSPCDTRSNHPDLEDSLTEFNKKQEVANVTVKRVTLSVADQKRKEERDKRFLLCAGLGLSDLTYIWEDHATKIYWDRKRIKYVCYRFIGFNLPKDQSWARTDYDTCPDFVPFTFHDIQARHFYKHSGKKKKRKTEYRGFEKELLTESAFLSKMEEGCLGCQRKPQWGNYVRFVSSEFFFCEWCEKDSSLVESFKSKGNKKVLH